jgi:hypothetical protein
MLGGLNPVGAEMAADWLPGDERVRPRLLPAPQTAPAVHQCVRCDRNLSW